MKIIRIYVFFLVFFIGCGPSKSLVYLSNLEPSDTFSSSAENTVVPRIQPGDLLSITVSTLQPESNVLFNSGVIHAVATPDNSGNTVNRITEGYLVDRNGTVNFPVLGKVQLAGLTREEAVDKMTIDLTKLVKGPIVNIRFQNFKITVIGEVEKPSSFTIPNERINVLEALGLAGDMTVFGNRENVLIIREREGARTNTRLNLNSKELLNSPYYFLQQNDILYVEPVRARAAQASLTRNNISIALSVLTILVFLLR